MTPQSAKRPLLLWLHICPSHLPHHSRFPCLPTSHAALVCRSSEWTTVSPALGFCICYFLYLDTTHLSSSPPPFFFFFRTTPSNHSGLSSAMTLSSGLSCLLQMGSSLSHHCSLTQNVSACWPQAFPFSTLDWKLILKGQDCGGFWLLCSQSLAHAWYIEKLNNCLLNKWIVGRGKDYITREEQKS